MGGCYSKTPEQNDTYDMDMDSCEDSGWSEQEKSNLAHLVDEYMQQNSLHYDNTRLAMKRETWHDITEQLSVVCDTRRKPSYDAQKVWLAVAVNRADRLTSLTQEDLLTLKLRKEPQVLEALCRRVLKKGLAEIDIDDFPDLEPHTDFRAQSFYLGQDRRFDTRYGLDQETYEGLEDSVREELNEIRDLIWQLSRAMMRKYPMRSVIRGFWSSPGVRKLVMKRLAFQWYEKRLGKTLSEECKLVLDKMRSY